MEVFKDLKNGFYLCNICAAQVKAKIWTAHTNGRKHRENVQVLKTKLLAKSDQNLKRTHSPDSSDVRAKKAKDEQDEQMNDELSYTLKTPWQREVGESSRCENSGPKNIIEGLPEGFFDNQELNNRVRDTVEKQKHLDEEMNKFFSEIEEEDRKQVEDDDVEAESSAIQKDIELIDEQIERWRAINELEKQREALALEAQNATANTNPNFNRTVESGLDKITDDDDDDDEDFDFNAINWRTKIL